MTLTGWFQIILVLGLTAVAAWGTGISLARL
jgi:hypothetical protein